MSTTQGIKNPSSFQCKLLILLATTLIPIHCRAECPLKLHLNRPSDDYLDLILTNNALEPYVFEYHNLPWAAQGGLVFQIYIDNKKIPTGRGVGDNGNTIKLWPGSTISKKMNISALAPYHEGVEISRVIIKWKYTFPENKIPFSCKSVEGEIAPP